MLLISRATKQYVRLKQINFEWGCSVTRIIVFTEGGGRGGGCSDQMFYHYPLDLKTQAEKVL